MRARALCGLAAALALLTSACASGGGTPAAGTGSAAPSAATGGFPVRAADCAGVETVFDAPPRRIVTSNAAALEMLLRLGAGDRVIGTGFPPGTGTMPADLAERAAAVPVLGRAVIAKEKLLGSGADLYVDTFASMGAMGGATGAAPTEQEFAAAGIKHVQLHSTACADRLTGPQQDLSEVAADIRRLGAITGTTARAEELVAGMDRTVGAVRTALAAVPADRRPSYFFFDADAGTKQPMAACGRQVANAVITLAGARNVFADCRGTFKPVSWEDVVAADPDWIQLGVRNRGSEAETRKAYEQAEAFLRDFPATRELKAVRAGHFVRIGSEVTTIAGVRNADTVLAVAHAVHPGLAVEGR
ncbi:ABC transporter substrate-binding protein [Kitasatospora sp. NPDC085895]|uniref:ABC transporter substrate-binding protein n=1 Tax=Kitasatospora sp. NPDC085895 TaxID=3155057 RepID=UPI00344C1C02